jgi:hypothetical protein
MRVEMLITRILTVIYVIVMIVEGVEFSYAHSISSFAELKS